MVHGGSAEVPLRRGPVGLLIDLTIVDQDEGRESLAYPEAKGDEGTREPDLGLTATAAGITGIGSNGLVIYRGLATIP